MNDEKTPPDGAEPFYFPEDEFIASLHAGMGHPGRRYYPRESHIVRRGAIVFGSGGTDGTIFGGFALDMLPFFNIDGHADRTESLQPQHLFRGDHLYLLANPAMAPAEAIVLMSIRVGATEALLEPVPERSFAEGRGAVFALPELPTCAKEQRISVRFHNGSRSPASLRSWLVGRWVF